MSLTMIATCWNQRSLLRDVRRDRAALRRQVLGQLDALVAEPQPHDAHARAEDARAAARTRGPRLSTSDVLLERQHATCRSRPTRSMSATVMPTLSTDGHRHRGGRRLVRLGRASRASDASEQRRRARSRRPERHSARMRPASCAAARSDAEALEQVVADAQRVGHDRQRGVHRAARREEAAVDDVEVVDIVRLAVHVERGGLRVVAEADRAVLVRHAGQRNALADEQVARGTRCSWHVDVHRARAALHSFSRDQPLVAFVVVRRVAQDDAARRGRA